MVRQRISNEYKSLDRCKFAKKTQIITKSYAQNQVCESEITMDTTTITTVPLKNAWMIVVEMG